MAWGGHSAGVTRTDRMNRRIYRATSKRALAGGGLPGASSIAREALPFGPEAAPSSPRRTPGGQESLGGRR
jgi:hypothetical protein